MKIDTKKCTPIKDSVTCKLNTNPYIPKDKEQEEKDDEFGRELTFIPEVIFTPVLSSKRTPNPYPRLSDHAVDDLTETICKMLISEKDEDKEPKVKKSSRAKDPVSSPLGRFEVEVIAEKSNTVVRVCRSLRLMS